MFQLVMVSIVSLFLGSSVGFIVASMLASGKVEDIQNHYEAEMRGLRKEASTSRKSNSAM